MVNIIHKFFYVNVRITYKNATIQKNDVSEGIDTNKQLHQKNVCFLIIGTL